MRLSLFSAVIVAGALLCGSATATVVYTESSFLPVPDEHGPIPTSFTGNVFVDFGDPGLISGVARSPWEDTIYDGSRYTSIDSPSLGGSTATFDLGGPKTQFSLLWGSPDDYNTLELLNDLDIVVGFLSGAVLSPHAIGYDFVSIFSDIGFTQVRLKSTGPAFEVANFRTVSAAATAPTPLPPALALFGSAVAGLGILARRRRRPATSATLADTDTRTI